ncbi:XdhC family protein [Seohaeicola saemankumensis]|nr:XdhC/CoxI family protein [Seohaeicola saemankumensis]MCA0871066.1 XdhC family protein [Seohaeicola saemankumensis]
MAQFDIFDTIGTLRQAGDAFCVATVMRTADATSAKAGAKAAITRDGRILGHLGGACVQRAVRAAAADALLAGAPQMIRVKPSDKVVAIADPDGVQTYKSGCPSGGTVDLLIEPYEHPPRLVIFGETPIARALASHAALAGFRVYLPEGGDGITAFDPEDLGALELQSRDFVVVASQGNGDRAALKAAVTSPARRVSMVASRRKAEVLSAKLIDAGLPEADVRRLKSPAGLDLKGVDPHEIALSVLAEIILWRNTDAPVRDATDEGQQTA